MTMPDAQFLRGVVCGAAAVLGTQLTLAGLLSGWLGWLVLGEREWPRVHLWPPERWGVR